MTSPRPYDLAGEWYPRTAEGCTRFLEGVPDTQVALPELAFGAIVPHAGWEHSGALAEQALRALARGRPEPELVIVFGGHLGPRDLPRIFLEGSYGTPLGPLAIASRVAEDASMAMESELETPDDFFDDTALEVLMPMIKRHWPEVEVVTIGVPPTEAAPELGVELVHLARRRHYEDVVVVASTDLTHYGPDHRFVPQGRGARGLEWVTKKNDPEMIEIIERFDAAQVLWAAQRSRNVCSPGAVAAAIAAAGKLGAARGLSLGYTTSFHTSKAAQPESFVGYASFLLAG